MDRRSAHGISMPVFGLLSAVGAVSEDVEAVAVRLEPLFRGELVDGFGDVALEGRGRGDVDNFAAAGAEEVVVMLGEVLGQLKASELVVGGDAPHHAGDLKVDKVAVGRTARHAWKASGDVTDADRMTGSEEQVDDRPSACGVALLDPPEPVGDLVMEAVDAIPGRFVGPRRRHHPSYKHMQIY
jgi:hypothetical protein